MIIIVIKIMIIMLINRILNYYDHNCNYNIFGNGDDSDMHRSNDSVDH